MQDPKKDIGSLLDKLSSEEVKKVVKGDGIPAALLESKNVGKKIEDILSVKVDSDVVLRNVEVATSNPILRSIVADLTNDPMFLSNVEQSIKKILADGQLTVSDVPEIVLLIMNAYHTVGNIKVEKEDLGDFVRLVFEFVVKKYNLLPVDKISEYESILISSVKLLLLTPQVSANLMKNFKCC